MIKIWGQKQNYCQDVSGIKHEVIKWGAKIEQRKLSKKHKKQAMAALRGMADK